MTASASSSQLAIVRNAPSHLHRAPQSPLLRDNTHNKGVSSPSVTVLSRAVTHRDTAAMPGWFNRAATGQLTGPRSAAMPSPHGGRAARTTFGNARREHITAGAAAALAGPPAGSYATVLAARIPDGQSALHLSGRCPGCGAGTRSSTRPDTRSSGRAYRATRSPFLPQSGSMEPRSRVTAGARCGNKLGEQARPARYPRHGAPDAAARRFRDGRLNKY